MGRSIRVKTALAERFAPFGGRSFNSWGRALAWSVTLVLGGTACESPEARRAGTGAQAPVQVDRFERDRETRNRILGLTQAEIVAALPNFEFSGRSRVVFSRGDEEVEQIDRLHFASEDVSRHHAVVSNERHHIEWFRDGSIVTLRYDEGPFRRKRLHDAIETSLGASIFQTLSASLEPFAHRVQFERTAETTLAGRSAVQFKVSLGAPSVRDQGDDPNIGVGPFRAPVLGAAGPARWRVDARPLDLSGSIWIDQATGVPLKAKWEGRLEVPDREVRPTQAVVAYQGEIVRVGATKFTIPTGRPEFEREKPPVKPLEFFREHLPPPPEGVSNLVAPSNVDE